MRADIERGRAFTYYGPRRGLLRRRGTAIGVYNTTQTLGLFFGGFAGGWLAKHYGAAAVFAACALLSTLWLAAASAMRSPAQVNGLSRVTL